MPAPPWALSLSPGHLALARVEARDEDALRVEELRLVDLPADTFQIGPLGGPLRNGHELASRCEQLLGSNPPSALSLVLPDEWIRLVFAESGELPRQPQARADILAWKLKRLVPFRVEELRFEGIETPAIAGQTEAQRILLTFGIEALLSQLEDVLTRCGTHVGRIRNRTLGMLSAARSMASVELAVALRVGTRSWSLLATHHGEPVLTRVRPLPTGDDATTNLVRELRLSRAWLAEALPRRQIEQVLLVCERDERDAWTSVLEAVFELPVAALEAEQPVGQPRVPQGELVPLCGAATEVIP